MEKKVDIQERYMRNVNASHFILLTKSGQNWGSRGYIKIVRKLHFRMGLLTFFF